MIYTQTQLRSISVIYLTGIEFFAQRGYTVFSKHVEDFPKLPFLLRGGVPEGRGGSFLLFPISVGAYPCGHPAQHKEFIE